MVRRTWMLGLCALAACDDAAGLARGDVDVVTAEGARVDVIAAASGEVTASAAVGASGRVRLPATEGDRLLIARDMVGQATVIEGVRPGREYAVFVIPALPTATVFVDLPLDARAVEYVVASRCGGTQRGAAPPVFAAVCAEVDELVVGVLDATGAMLLAGAQTIGAPQDGATIPITAALRAPRPTAIAVTPLTPDAPTSVEAALVTRQGTAFAATPVPSAALAAAPILLPALDGDVRVSAVIPGDAGGRRELVVRAPLDRALDLDFARAPLPAITAAASFDAERATIRWTTALAPGGTPPDTVRVRFFGEDRRAYTVIAPYTGDELALPALPAGAPPLAPAGAIELTLAATPEGYNVTVNTLTRREDPTYRGFALALISHPGT